jgi:hypothetical protein
MELMPADIRNWIEEQFCNNIPEIQARLCRAIINNDQNQVSELVAQGANINYLYNLNFNDGGNRRFVPLDIATEFLGLNKSMVNHLMNLGADCNIYGGDQSLLHSYCYNLDLENIINVLNRGMDINNINNGGNTALHRIIKKIILDTDVDRIRLLSVLSPNYYESLKDQKIYEIIEYLISRGADLTLANNNGETPLMLLEQRNLEYLADHFIKEPYVLILNHIINHYYIII